MRRWDWQQDSAFMGHQEAIVYPQQADGKSWEGEGSVDLDLIHEVHQRLIAEIDPKKLESLPKPQARDAVMAAAKRILSDIAPSAVGEFREAVVDAVADEVLGLGPIEKVVADPAVSEVMINSPTQVYWEEAGVIYKSRIRFRDEDHIMRVAQRIVAPLGRRIDEASPYVDARLADGSRVNIIIPPVAYRSPVITIRKFLGDKYTIADLAATGTMSDEVADFIGKAIVAKLNIVFSGGTGTGKTTLLNAFSAFIPERERILTIEDPAELKLQQEHVIGLEVRMANIEGRNEVTQRDLVRNALRMRPDRIIVGEVRGSESFDMLQAMNTGHEGSMTTVHANSARDALARIENMMMMAGYDLPIRVIREQVASALHLVVQISRFSDGSRKIVSVSEITGMEGQTVTMQDLFVFERRGLDAEGKVLGSLVPTGIRPHHLEKFTAAGIDLPIAMFARAR
jgi:pilus assembly protein CpaF